MASAPRSEKIWMDGRLVNWDDANVHLLTHTLHYGLGVFEGIRCYETADGPAVFRLAEHTRRLFTSARIVGIQIPFTEEEVNRAVLDTLRANKLRQGYIRPLVYLGDEVRGLNCKGSSVHLGIAVWSWGAYLGEEALEKGIDVKTSSFTRHHPNVFMTKAKVCGAYVNSIMAKLEAVNDGYDEALLLDPNGFVAEGSGENLFIVRNGKLKTPPLTSTLEGITRDSIMVVAREMGIAVEEQYFSRDEVYLSDEAFFTGTAAEMTPINSLDRRIIGAGGLGPVSRRIQSAFFDILKGKSAAYRHWLTHF
ncbi:MAG: branched-chain amino acid transaminase [Nitrospinae bacterium]|nr:branched-chain amino acid transaminase [Nitrospinota bacterium]